jgi:hypothetical protein
MPMKARVLLREGAAELRQLVQRVADVGVALLEELSPPIEVIGTVDSRFGRRMREPVTVIA